MIWALAGAMAVAAATAARPPPSEQPLTATRHRSVAEAVGVALASGPVVVAFGELHQTRDTAEIPSALRRFTQEILPGLVGQLSHLVVETWITSGRCGEAERAVTKDVEKTTERPAATASEIETLIRAVDAGGAAPRILSITCADYEAMRPQGQDVDYDRTLRITARALETAAFRALGDRRRREGVASPGTSIAGASEPSGRPARPIVGIYGGALHNDVHPVADLAGYTFASGMMASTLGRYVEIDLVVPEYAAASAAIQAQDWWRAYQRSPRPRGVVMVRRSSRSFVVVFPTHAKAR